MALPKRQIKDAEQRKIFGKVFDELAVRDLFKIKSKGIFDTYKGIIKEGKESRILLVYKENEPRIIKIYKIEAGNFKHLHAYLQEDERFRHVKGNRRAIMYAWCKKEYHNLQIAINSGVNAPKPYYYLHNIIAMEMIGKEKPYPQLKYVSLDKPLKVLDNLLSQLKNLANKGNLVHGDISEFNILVDDKEIPYIIDFAQGVLVTNPFAKEMAVRDIKNLINYFNKQYGIDYDFEDVFRKVYKGVFL